MLGTAVYWGDEEGPELRFTDKPAGCEPYLVLPSDTIEAMRDTNLACGGTVDSKTA